MNCSRTLAWAGALALVGVHAAAAGQPVGSTTSLSATVGPLGLGVGLGQRLSDQVSLRLVLHSGSLYTQERDDVKLQGIRYDLRQRAGPGLALLGDWQPWAARGWRFTGGLVLARFKTTLEGRPDRFGNYNLNGTVYNVAQVGALSGSLRSKPVSGYVGAGWDSSPAGTPGWRWVSDLGLLLMAKPDVTLSSSAGSGDATLQQNLAGERSQLRKVGLGLTGAVGVAYGF